MPIHENPGLADLTMSIAEKADMNDALKLIHDDPRRAALEIIKNRQRIKGLEERLEAYRTEAIPQVDNSHSKPVDNQSSPGIMGT